MTDQKPGLAGIVANGGEAPQAVPVADGIWMSADVSNAYLVNGDGAHFLVNTGTPLNAKRNREAFTPIAAGLLEAIVVTQSHPDHFGGVVGFRQARTTVIVGREFPHIRADYERTAPYLDERTYRLWEPLLGSSMRGNRAADPFEPDVLVSDRHVFSVGGVQAVAISAPGGETRDGLIVHLPERRIVFTGNLFGPAWRNLPNLYTIRGDRIRSAVEYLRCLDLVRSLEPDLLVTGHGEPIRGAEVIDRDLKRMRGAVQYLLDYTLDGMNAGKDVRTLMREVEIPPEFEVGQLHGKDSWNVRGIWEEYVGWFDYGSTTELYGVPRSAVAGDLVSLAGAVGLTERAAAYVATREPLKALHILDVVLAASPDDRSALAVKKEAHQVLLAGGTNNLSETMWLKAEILACERALGERP